MPYGKHLPHGIRNKTQTPHKSEKHLKLCFSTFEAPLLGRNILTQVLSLSQNISPT